MSSASDYEHSEASQEASDEASRPPTRPVSRASRPESRASTPRKRRRLESVDPSQVRRHYLKGKYNDAYRVLYNDDVSRAATRFEASSEEYKHRTTQIGASVWSAAEQATFFAALERLGRDDLPGIAGAIGTKSIPETQELLLLLHDAAVKQGDAKVTLRDIPAATEVGSACAERLDVAGEALAWYQETFEANQEKERYGDYWLITPAIAETIEDALNPSRPRATTSPIASEPEARRRGGRVIAGACISCKKLKERCDRGTPCSNCVRHKTLICVYPENSLNSEQLERPENSLKPEHRGRPEQLGKGTETNSILEAIPEAQLLHPQLMLSLSKTLFMNRSPTIPSPWPHWSEYTSEFAEEPSIYRSAFNDFHTLVVSVTKRLMQTAITQATSRLRSQRPRVKKGGGLPLVKRRDVLAAIDIVGMKRNGKERWRGVARRCSLRVYDGYWSRYQNNRTRREVPWDEVEKIMTVIEPSVEALTTDAETPDTDTPNFKSRAVRSGTPLPMERLALSDSEDDDSADNSDDSMSDDAERLSRHTVPPTRDAMGRYISVAPTIADRGQSNGTLTLEQFDTEASRQEEHTLWQMLGLEPPTKDEDVESDEDNDESDFKNDEKIVTQPDGWRSWVGYHAEWEEFSIPMSPMEFTANQKPLAAPPVLSTQALDHAGSSSDDCIEKARVADSSSDDDTGANTYSRQRSQRKSKHNAQQAIELQARGALAYAALQSRAKFGRSEDESNANNTSNSSGNEENLPYRSPGASNRPPVVSLTDIDSSDSSDTNADQPTQSIETRMPAATSDDESTDTEIDRPTQSVKAGSKKSPVVVSDDDDSSDSSDVELDRPTRPIQTGTRRPPALHSDDEMGEMDWDTFIE